MRNVWFFFILCCGLVVLPGLVHGASPSEEDLASVSCFRTREKMESALGNGTDPNHPYLGTLPLFHCIDNNKDWGVELLLKAGAGVDVADPAGGQRKMQSRHLQDTDGPTQTGVTPLMWAAQQSRDPQIILHLLEHGANIHALDAAGRTPLCYAGWNDRCPAVLPLLLERGADPLVRDSDGNTTLMHALAPFVLVSDMPQQSIEQHLVPSIDNMLLLLKAGVDINARNNKERTALALAVMQPCQPAAARVLLENKADPNIPDDRRVTPLLLAAGNQSNCAVLELLLAAGADPAAVDMEGQDVFFWAASGGYPQDILPFLFGKKLKPVLRDSYGRTPLMYLSGYSQPVVAQLLQAGCRMDAVDGNGRSVLMWSCGKRDFGRLQRALIEAGVPVAGRDKEGRTVLHYAAQLSVYPPAVEFLMAAVGRQKGKESAVDVLDGMGRTPLMYAAAFGPDAVIRLFLDKGARTDVVDKNGWTVLHHAMSRKSSSYGALQTLFSAQQETDGVTRDGATLLHILGEYLRVPPEISCLLPAEKADPMLCGRSGKKTASQTLRQVLEHVKDVDARDVAGRTPLMLFAKNSDSSGPLKLLAETGASILALDNNGMPPLLYAAENKDSSPARFLLDAGAKADVVDKNGRNALHHVVMGAGSADVADLFVKAGVDARQKDSEGKTAFDLIRSYPDADTPALRKALQPDEAR